MPPDDSWRGHLLLVGLVWLGRLYPRDRDAAGRRYGREPLPLLRGCGQSAGPKASLARLAAMAATTVLACHAPETIGPALLAQNRTYFDQLERCCRTAWQRGVPLQPAADAELEELVDFPFAEAIPAGTVVAQPEFYRPSHQAHIRMMLAWLTTQAGPG